MTDALNREVGRLEGRLTALEAEMKAYKLENNTKLASIEKKLDDITDILSQGRGGWKAAAWLAGAIATVAVSVDWVWEKLHKVWP
jgi:hypothetical protein